MFLICEFPFPIADYLVDVHWPEIASHNIIILICIIRSKQRRFIDQSQYPDHFIALHIRLRHLKQSPGPNDKATRWYLLHSYHHFILAKSNRNRIIKGQVVIPYRNELTIRVTMCVSSNDSINACSNICVGNISSFVSRIIYHSITCRFHIFPNTASVSENHKGCCSVKFKYLFLRPDHTFISVSYSHLWVTHSCSYTTSTTVNIFKDNDIYHVPVF